MQQNEELFWGKIFIHYINRLGGFDYQVKPFSTTTTDIRGVSQSGKYPELYMELTWVKEIEFNPAKLPTLDLFFKKEDIEKAIESKTPKINESVEKGENVNHIILLLQGYMSSVCARDILTDEFCNQYRSNPFRGIYYLVRPPTDLKSKENPEDGEVLTIKPSFVFGKTNYKL